MRDKQGGNNMLTPYCLCGRRRAKLCYLKLVVVVVRCLRTVKVKDTIQSKSRTGRSASREIGSAVINAAIKEYEKIKIKNFTCYSHTANKL
jgi:hypothetical protein